MVNVDEFTKRLSRIMEYYDLSAASFADKIEVGRSSISHLLSGRNKPSLDFVMKIVKAFPEVELYWLLNGKGSFPKNSAQVKEQEPQKPVAAAVQDLFTPPSPIQEHTAAGSPMPHRKIKKIVVLYTDGTFEAYEG